MHALFIINGLGMGNATRCHGIIQELHDRDVDICVISSGNGATYFSGAPEVSSLYEVPQMHYGSRGGSISTLRTMALLPKYIELRKKNDVLIDEVIEEKKPDVVVLDSTYVTRPMRRRNIPIVAINNSDFIVKNYFKMGELPPLSTVPQFLFVEFMDYLFHRSSVDCVLSPSLVPTEVKVSGIFRTVGPLVRRGYVSTPNCAQPTRGVVMLSGSAFGSQIQSGFDTHGLQIDVIGRQEPEGWPPERSEVTFHGKLMDNKDIVLEADLAIVNCGYSAVSESINLHKPLAVVPIPNHSEQWVNAMVVKNHALGIVVSEAQIESGIRTVIEKFQECTHAYEKLAYDQNNVEGRVQAADVIVEIASSCRAKGS
jgi:hypothetical protein